LLVPRSKTKISMAVCPGNTERKRERKLPTRGKNFSQLCHEVNPIT